MIVTGALVNALLGSKAVRWAVLGFSIVLAYQIWLSYFHDAKVRARALEQVDSQARELTANAKRAAAPASQPGSPERLRKRWCRDC